MDSETILDELHNDAATFISTLCYRDIADVDAEVVNHDGNVVLISEHKQGGKQSLWRALHECVTEPETEVLFVSPNPAGAQGVILLIEDELKRGPFGTDIWGVKRTSKTEIEFENGSRIVSHHAGDDDGDRCIRGFHPDLLVVDTWEEEGYQISDKTKLQVLVPMLTGDNDIWVHDTFLDSADPLIEAAVTEGAYVKQLDL